ncbi:beta strand repeat-containing protein [Flavobacterium sp. N2270]|uniref:beta strand repeat-containing protein n=1 Tax=Flavobacterium sp. N2270 TaxID=2986831 RepID=UPI00222466FA|nr:hypothetical protein [Flavobacterium sp. N2270]
MKTNKTILMLLIGIFTNIVSGQVGVGTTTPAGALDITSTTTGFVPPRVALTALNAQAPIVNPQTGVIPNGTIVYNTATAGTAPNIVTPGLYYWLTNRWIAFAGASGGLDWSLIGNTATTAGTNFLGTTDAQGLHFKTNNVERGRFGATGRYGLNLNDQTWAQFFSYSNDNTIDAAVGYSDADGGRGLYGRSTGASSLGILGTNDNDGIGIQGQASGTNGVGTVGFAGGNNAMGIFGVANGTNGRGVNGQSSGADALGVAGFVSAAGTATTTPIAIYGSATGVSSIGVFGTANGANATNSAFGIYGSVNNATTNGNTDAAAISGINSNATQGLGYAGPNVLATPSAIVGISGSVSSKRTNTTGAGSRSYNFGVMGELLVDTTVPGATIQRQSGGVIGIGVSGVWGSAGYKDSGNNNYGIYSTSAFVSGTGRNSNNTSNSIGLGVNGGVIGGYVKGEQYGFISKGNQFGAYIMGNTITNRPITQIETVNNNKIVSYATTSTTVDVTTRGKGQLTNGAGFVSFDTAFTQIAELNDDNLNITITAKGNTNGIYIEKVTSTGFYVKENMNGNHSVEFNWTATSVRKGYENGVSISREILDTNWENNMSKVMHNENDTTNEALPISFDGTNVKFEELPKQFQPEERKADNSKNINRTPKSDVKEIEVEKKEITTDETIEESKEK